MKNKIMFIALIIVLFVAVVFLLFNLNFLSFPEMETMDKEKESPKYVMSVDDLENERFYIWHNDKESNIKKDLSGTTSIKTFKKCPEGKRNWDNDDFGISHTLWFNLSNDIDIPVCYPEDKLIYISSSKIPFEGIQWERFGDYGYTIGVANLIGDKSGHYHIENSNNGYESYLNPDSDAIQLQKFTNVSELFIDKLGNVSVRENFVSDGGTLFGLNKGTKYVCEWYSGTFFQDYEMTADTHAFCSLETFTTYDYEFLHSNCISIDIPAWLKTGCYYVNGIGFFRYISENDMYKYNGKAYDPNIDWNDRIIIYDENDFLLYDPSTGYESDTYKESNSDESKQEQPDPYSDNQALYEWDQESQDEYQDGYRDEMGNPDVNESDAGDE